MEITLVRATIQDAENLWKMQIVAFQDLYAKYQDPETSPATETLEKTMTRLEQPYTYYYISRLGTVLLGQCVSLIIKKMGSINFSLPFSL